MGLGAHPHRPSRRPDLGSDPSCCCPAAAGKSNGEIQRFCQSFMVRCTGGGGGDRSPSLYAGCITAAQGGAQLLPVHEKLCAPEVGSLPLPFAPAFLQLAWNNQEPCLLPPQTELYRHIGGRTDIPAGDIGCGQKEIGYL